MKKPINHKIIFVGGDQNQTDQVCRLLLTHHYTTRPLKTFQMVEALPEGNTLEAVLVDLDSILLSDVDIRKFKRAHPQTPLLAISGETFHPNLRESMQSHIFACVSKPVDPEELIFLLNCALENGPKSNQSN